MGAYQIWHIEFKDKKSKEYFEKLKLHQRKLCTYDYFNEEDLQENKRTCEVTYFMGLEGYGEGGDLIRKHGKKLNMKKFYSLDLSTRSDWYNEIKRFKEEY